jgi:hypothetical protein
MLDTSTGRHQKMPVLVSARLAKGKIPVWAPNVHAYTGIGTSSVPVLALVNNKYESTGTGKK